MIQVATPTIGEPVTLPLHQIAVAPQIRTRNGFDEQSLRELADTIKAVGLLSPLVVRQVEGDRYELIAGERRLLACELAGLAEVPVLVRQVESDAQREALQAIENLQRVELCLFDRADGVAAMVAKLGAKRTASMLGKSPAWVSKHLMASKLPEAVRLAAQEGDCEDLEVLQCVKAIGSHSAEAYGEAIWKLADGTLGRGEARRMLDELSQAGASSSEGEDDAGEGDGEGGSAGDKGPATAVVPSLIDAARKLVKQAEALLAAAEAGERPAIDKAINKIREVGREVTGALERHDRDAFNKSAKAARQAGAPYLSNAGAVNHLAS